jgi:hypothetical protein
MAEWLERLVGVALMAAVLADVFLTVLYARAGTGILSRQLAHLVWRVFHSVGARLGRTQSLALSLCGPSILVLLVAVWAGTLCVGAACVIHHALGRTVVAQSGSTTTDFVTAMYAAAGSLSIVGNNYSPRSTIFRFLYLFNSLAGLSVMSLTLTYLMQVYSALHRRNELGLKVHLQTAETGDAAELIARLGPSGQFSAGYATLSEFAGEVSSTKEAHHFYPVLFYFRFRDAYYSVSRFTLVALDTASLMRTALDDHLYGWLQASAAVELLARGPVMLLKTLGSSFPSARPDADGGPSEQQKQRWRLRYVAAIARLKQAGIRTAADERAGADKYVRSRAEWDKYITALAPVMAYRIEEIDSAGCAIADAATR